MLVWGLQVRTPLLFRVPEAESESVGTSGALERTDMTSHKEAGANCEGFLSGGYPRAACEVCGSRLCEDEVRDEGRRRYIWTICSRSECRATYLFARDLVERGDS